MTVSISDLARSSFFARVLACVAVLGFSACGGGSDADAEPVPMGQFECRASGDFCSPDQCVGARCVAGCESDADCEAGEACGVSVSGSGICLPACETLFDALSGFSCEDGAQVECTRVGEGHCGKCGCPDAQRCDGATGQCGPLSDIGGPCQFDDECTTLNCSEYAGKCRVPLGQPCDETNCDDCIALESENYSFCSRGCSQDSTCGDFACDRGSDLCVPPCGNVDDPSCPGSCDTTSTGARFCDCTECEVLVPVRGEGEGCDYDGQCVEGDCFSTPAGGVCAVEGCGEQCPDGHSCVDVPCPDGVEACGLRCLRSCELDSCQVGFCHDLPLAEGGGVVPVCNPKRPTDASCAEDDNCQSGNCLSTVCADPGGSANGEPCSNPDDCLDGTCIGGTCIGSGTIGDACQIDEDCSVGDCCVAGDQAGTCQSSC